MTIREWLAECVRTNNLMVMGRLPKQVSVQSTEQPYRYAMKVYLHHGGERAVIAAARGPCEKIAALAINDAALDAEAVFL